MSVRNVAVVLTLTLALLSSDAYARSRKHSLAQQMARAVSTQFVTAPKDGEVCFSPDEPCDVKLVKFLQTAQTSIDVAIFDINLDQVAHELLMAARAKKVRVIVDKRQAKGEYSLVPTLIKGGVAVRYGKQRSLMHNKFGIVDGKRIVQGSFNWTNNATFSNQENSLYTGTPEVVKRFVDRFEMMWAQAIPTD